MDRDGWRKFLQILVATSDSKMLEKLSKLLFTPEEREALSSRIRVIEELLKGEKTQREIAKKYNISIATITRGSNALKEVPKEMLDYLKGVME